MKYYIERKYGEFKEWFLEKHHPHSTLNKSVFVHDILKFAGFFLVFLIIYNNISKLNTINLIILRLGSVLLLVSLLFVIKKAWHLIINLKYWFRGFNNGTKLLISIIIVLLLFFAFSNQAKVVDSLITSYDKIEFNRLNPLSSSINLSSIGLGGLFSNLNSCSQINVSMQNGKIPAQTYDDWKIYQYPCDALTSFFGCPISCYKGNTEGQNRNYYYCGDQPQFLYGKELATMDKTPISNDGTIGKRIRKTFVNIYDSNGKFLKTICGKDPEQITEDEWNKFKRDILDYWGP